MSSKKHPTSEKPASALSAEEKARLKAIDDRLGAKSSFPDKIAAAKRVLDKLSPVHA